MKQGRKGIGRNQGAERLRKPESAAQPGEVNPVQVASQYQSAEGARNLKRVGLGTRKAFGWTGKRGGAGWVKRSSGAKGQERRDDFLPRIISGTCRENLKVHPSRRSTKRAVLNQ
jgi:hypothetical protein